MKSFKLYFFTRLQNTNTVARNNNHKVPKPPTHFNVDEIIKKSITTNSIVEIYEMSLETIVKTLVCFRF